jgi:hypothetical protein
MGTCVQWKAFVALFYFCRDGPTELRRMKGALAVATVSAGRTRLYAIIAPSVVLGREDVKGNRRRPVGNSHTPDSAKQILGTLSFRSRSSALTFQRFKEPGRT